jgi:tetrahydromethanopterin S-methyltransferase subunit G
MSSEMGFVNSERYQRIPKNFAIYVVTMLLMLATYLFYVFATDLPGDWRWYGLMIGLVICTIFNGHLANELRTQQCHTKGGMTRWKNGVPRNGGPKNL